MDRNQFLCCALSLFEIKAQAQDTKPAEIDREKEFVKNWLTDLFDSMDKVLDQQTKVKVMAGCGQGCFRRHQFKQEIARLGRGSVDALLAAYRKNFEVWQEGTEFHIRYGAVSKQCYCPAARYHPALPNDMHCECTRATHQTVIETALGRPVDVKVVESLRRGGKTCHFVAQVA